MKYGQQRGSLLDKYNDRVKESTLLFDRKQADLLTELEALAAELEIKSLSTLFPQCRYCLVVLYPLRLSSPL